MRGNWAESIQGPRASFVRKKDNASRLRDFQFSSSRMLKGKRKHAKFVLFNQLCLKCYISWQSMHKNYQWGILHSFVHSKSLEASTYVIVRAHLNSRQPHFQCSTATRGQWLPRCTAETRELLSATSAKTCLASWILEQEEVKREISLLRTQERDDGVHTLSLHHCSTFFKTIN